MHLKIEQLAQHLENYCTSRTAEGATKEDMESGNVWNKDGHHHFIFTHFIISFYTDTNGQKNMT